MSVTVIVFAKAPVAGLAKTRLAPALGAEGAAALAERLLVHAVAQAARADIGPLEICTTPDPAHPVFQRLATQHGATLSVQGDGDLGQRMHRALARVLVRPGRALLIGTDAPALDASMLRLAADRLLTHEVVFVPAMDGGYALIGQRRADARWFSGMSWSTPRSCATHGGVWRRAAWTGPSCRRWPTSTSRSIWCTCLQLGCHEALAGLRACRPAGLPSRCTAAVAFHGKLVRMSPRAAIRQVLQTHGHHELMRGQTRSGSAVS